MEQGEMKALATRLEHLEAVVDVMVRMLVESRTGMSTKELEHQSLINELRQFRVG